MNVITCGALLCLHVDTISQDKRIVFAACLCLCLVGAFLSQKFISVFPGCGKKEELAPAAEEEKSGKSKLQ